jgi:hypothetical protein
LKLYLGNEGLGSVERLENVSIALILKKWFKKFGKTVRKQLKEAGERFWK